MFLAIILKLMALLTEINLIGINFSSSEKLQYDLNNFISFSNSFISFLFFDKFLNSSFNFLFNNF